MTKTNTHKILVVEQVVTINQNGCDAAQYLECDLEIVPINQTGKPAFCGTLAECEKWYDENYQSYRLF